MITIRRLSQTMAGIGNGSTAARTVLPDNIDANIALRKLRLTLQNGLVEDNYTSISEWDTVYQNKMVKGEAGDLGKKFGYPTVFEKAITHHNEELKFLNTIKDCAITLSDLITHTPDLKI